jgi:osmotically inducible protein OsmC
MGISKATGGWDGAVKDGKGFMKPAHGPEVPFSAGSRFEGQAQSNPEELIGAALCGCFSMALTANLGNAGHPPKSVRTSADVTIEKQPGGFAITTIALTTEAVVPGVEDAKFQETAETTRKTCPVAKVLAGARITLTATLGG